MFIDRSFRNFQSSRDGSSRNWFMLTMFATSTLLFVPPTLCANLNLSQVWFQHTHQILSVFDQLSQVDANQTAWNQTNACRNSLQELVHDARLGQFYANKMVDSIGRPTSGILEGRLSYLGRYEECVATSSAHFSGKYCITHIELPSNFSHILSNISGISSSLYANRLIKLGVCLPSTCMNHDVYTLVDKFSRMFSPSLTVRVSECMERDSAPSQNVDLLSLSVFGGLCGLLLVLILIATFYEQLCFHRTYSQSDLVLSTKIVEHKPEIVSIVKQSLLAFSLKRNLHKIFHVDSSGDALSVFHGIKFFAMLWIIFMHSVSFSSQWMNFNNPQDVRHISRNVLSQPLLNGTFSVDCFFFISGYLVAHLLLKRLEVNGSRQNWSVFYLNRYIRMTPTMMLVIGFGAIVLRYFGNGPEWTNSTVMFDLWCRKNWWVNLFYLHNFVDTDNMCLSHSWYSAVDTQLFLVSPLLVVLLHRKPTLGFSLCTLLLMASVALTWTLTIINDYPAVPYFNDLVPLDRINSYYQNIYIKPYCRIGPYLVGIMLSYVMLHTRNNFKIPKSYLVAGWTFTLVSTLGILLAMLPANQGHLPNTQVAALYSATSRVLWALGLSWITFVSMHHHGGFLNKFLSLRAWVPFSRLTYCAYLVHPLIIALFCGTRQQTFDYSFYLIFYFTLSNVCITYFVSLLVALLIEYPVIALGKVWLAKG